MSKKIEGGNVSSRMATMSKMNKWNINLTLFQKWYMALLSTLILPNAFRMVKDDIKYPVSYCALVIGMTPLGGIISMFFTKFYLDSSFKIPMIISAVLSLLGNVLYILGIGANSISLCCLSRLLIGFALNTVIHRRYLLEYIPKRKIGKYMLYFKLSYLSGISCGPLLTLIMSFITEYTFNSTGEHLIKFDIYEGKQKLIKAKKNYFDFIKNNQTCFFFVMKRRNRH